MSKLPEERGMPCLRVLDRMPVNWRRASLVTQIVQVQQSLPQGKEHSPICLYVSINLSKKLSFCEKSTRIKLFPRDSLGPSPRDRADLFHPVSDRTRGPGIEKGTVAENGHLDCRPKQTPPTTIPKPLRSASMAVRSVWYTTLSMPEKPSFAPDALDRTDGVPARTVGDPRTEARLLHSSSTRVSTFLKGWVTRKQKPYTNPCGAPVH